MEQKTIRKEVEALLSILMTRHPVARSKELQQTEHPSANTLAAYLEGKLSSQALDNLWRHLAECELCGEFVKFLEQTPGDSANRPC